MFLASEKLGTIYDPKASWDRFEGQHEGQHTSAVFPAALNIIIVSEMQIATKLHR